MNDVDASEPQPVTVLDRLIAAGIGEDRARQRIEEGAVQVNGERVTDPAAPCPYGEARPVLNPQ